MKEWMDGWPLDNNCIQDQEEAKLVTKTQYKYLESNGGGCMSRVHKVVNDWRLGTIL